MWLHCLLPAASGALLIQATLADVPFSTDAEAYNPGALGTIPNQTFRSSPIIAPIFQVTTLDRDAADPTPYLFLEWSYDMAASPMIFRSDDLSLVYCGNRYRAVTDVRVQHIGGKPHLTYWEGLKPLGSGIGHGHGYGIVLDETYELRCTISPAGIRDGIPTDLHEFQFTDEGTALITVYDPIRYDLTPIGGSEDGILLDSVFQEIDPSTGEEIFTWRASDHWRPEDSLYLPIEIKNDILTSTISTVCLR